MKKHQRVKATVAALLAAAALLPSITLFSSQNDSTASRFQLNPPARVMAYEAKYGYYNMAFKSTAYVTSHFNVNNIQESRLLYQNWNNIYGLAANGSQVKWPQAYSTHRGQDWDTLTANEALYAIHYGKVTHAAYDYNYGNRVEYEFGDWKVMMAHMSRLDVKAGDTVQWGQKLGNVGATGNVTGEHVHIAIYYQGKLVDPHPFVTGAWDFETKAAELSGQSAPNNAASAESGFQPGIYTNTFSTGIRVRSGAGTGYGSVGTVYPGQSVSITQIAVSGGIVWGKHSQGWSSIQEGSTRYMTPKCEIGSYRNATSLNLMIRSSASTSGSIVGVVSPGQSVQITSFAIVGNDVWGKHAGGWSCLSQGSSTYLRAN